MSTPQEMTSRTFEVTGSGFDASSHATDDRVFWVKAANHDEVLKALAGTQARFHGVIDAETDIDFFLPAQAGLLKARLLEFEVCIALEPERSRS